MLMDLDDSLILKNQLNVNSLNKMVSICFSIKDLVSMSLRLSSDFGLLLFGSL